MTKIGRKPGRSSGEPATYKGAGVNVAAAGRAVEAIRERVRSTFTPEVIGEIGGFGGLYSFDSGRYREPVLVSSADGVGTKVMIGQMMGIHEPLGMDLVAHSANDISTTGARPLFFLDYIVMEQVDESVIEELVKGMAQACMEAGCALIGGEIAEHPGHLPEGSYDLAGFMVGVVERSRLITGSNVSTGDVLLGMASSGLHCNGFSVVRKVLLEEMGMRLTDRPIHLARPLGEELLRPMLDYSQVVTKLADEVEVKGLAHITGGGIAGNLQRIVPEGLTATVDTSKWEAPPIFKLLTSVGRVSREEMFSTFNMGVGMIAVVEASDANHALDVVRSLGHHAQEIGAVDTASRGWERVEVV